MNARFYADNDAVQMLARRVSELEELVARLKLKLSDLESRERI